MDGYERQLGPLEKQSNDAKKYLTLRDRLRELEVSDYLYRVDNSESQKSKIRDKIEAFDLQIKNREDDVRRADEEYTDTMVRIGTIDQQISKLHDEQTRLAVAAESVRGKGNTLTERISNLIELRKQSEQRQVELEKQLEDKTAELADYVNHLGMFTEEKEDLNRDIAETDKKYLTLTDEIVGRERDIENTNRALLEAMESIAEIKADKGKLSAERESALQRIGELNDECNALKLMIEREEENKRKLEESVSKLEKQKNKLAKNKNDVAAEVSDLRARIDDKRLTQEELAGEVSALETKHRILSNNDTKISAKLLLKTIEGNPQYEIRVEGMIASMIKVPREYEIAIDLALGSASQNVVVRDEEDAKVLIRLLRDRDLGRVTFLPMTSYGGKGLETYQKSILHEKGCIGVANELISYAPKYQSVMLGLLGKTVVFDNIDNAVAAARRNAYSVRIVTLDGDVLNTSGSISGGSNKRNSLLMQEREIKTTEEQIKSKRKEYSALQQEILQDREYLAELQAQLEEYEEDVKNAEVAYATEFERLDRISNKIETALEDLDNKSKMPEILNGKLEFIESNLLNIDKSVTDISGTKGNRDEADRTKAEFEEKKRLRDKYSKDLSDMRVRLAEVASAITKVNENIVRVKRECEEINEEINDCKARIKELNSRIGFAESNRADAVVSEEDKKKYAEATAKIEELNGLKITLNERITYLNDLKDAQSKEIMALNESKVRQEAALEKIDDMMVSARNHIEEEYGLADDEMNRYRLDDFDPSVSAGEITKLKREKTALGAVNLDAIEMFKEIGAEYSTKKVEYDDLVKAKEDFEKIIADLAKQMQEQFNTEFAKINENVVGFMYLTKRIMDFTSVFFIAAFAVVYQSDLKAFFNKIARTRDKSQEYEFNSTDDELVNAAEQIVKACQNMAKNDVGALIIIVRTSISSHILETGTELNAEISSGLLESIFSTKGPLHDGAVIVKGSRLLSAGCFLPLSQKVDIAKELGTRHRAAIGVTEESDVFAIVVSEETGIISTVEKGKIRRYMTPEKLFEQIKVAYGITQDTSGREKKRENRFL